jgi:hypothetical protein
MADTDEILGIYEMTGCLQKRKQHKTSPRARPGVRLHRAQRSKKALARIKSGPTRNMGGDLRRDSSRWFFCKPNPNRPSPRGLTGDPAFSLAVTSPIGGLKQSPPKMTYAPRQIGEKRKRYFD